MTFHGCCSSSAVANVVALSRDQSHMSRGASGGPPPFSSLSQRANSITTLAPFFLPSFLCLKLLTPPRRLFTPEGNRRDRHRVLAGSTIGAATDTPSALKRTPPPPDPPPPLLPRSPPSPPPPPPPPAAAASAGHWSRLPRGLLAGSRRSSLAFASVKGGDDAGAAPLEGTAAAPCPVAAL